MIYHISVLIGFLCRIQPPPPTALSPFWKREATVMSIPNTQWTIRLYTEGLNCILLQTPLTSTKYFIVLHSLVGVFY